MRFYTLPPDRKIQYPYLLVNAKNYKELYFRKFQHAILDSGIEWFLKNPSALEYPPYFLQRWRGLARHLSRRFEGQLWVTCPDYPDNYQQFNGKNIELTLRNIEDFLSIDGVEWLPVVQSRYLDLFSYYYSLQETKRLIGDYPRVGIGTVCKTKRLNFIEHCCKATRAWFPNSHIHAFGLILKALPRIRTVVDSSDSLIPSDFGRKKKWAVKKSIARFLDSFDPLIFNSRNRGTLAPTKKYAIKYFYAYLKRMEEILDQNLIIEKF